MENSSLHQCIAPLTLRLFGELRAYREGGADSASAGRKAQALLAYLALNPRQRCTRERLASLLWGDRSEEQARHSLRQSVLVLRKALDDESGTILMSDGERLTLNPDATDVDVRRFERLAATNTQDALEEARALYTGELLEGIDVRSEEFEKWLAAERTRLHDLAADVLQRLSQICIGSGHWDEALDSAQQLIALDPAHEEGHQVLMRIFDRTGHRPMALRPYRLCEDALKRELDAQPSPETIRLHAQIRARTAETEEASEKSAADVIAQEDVPQSAAPLPAVDVQSSRSTDAAPPSQPRRRTALATGIVATMIAALAALAVLQSGGLPKVEQADPVRMQFPLPEKPSIAVLPFENLTGDPAQDSLGDAITSEITTTLSIISQMFVVDRSTTIIYRTKSTTARAVAEELGVRYVLEGSFQKAGDQVRVSANLVDALVGRNLWAERYEGDVTDIFALQDKITLAIVTALQVHMTEGEQERVSAVHGTHNYRAWVLAGRGLQILRRLTKGDNTRAREIYREAVALDPNYPGAWDGLAWSYLLDARFGWSQSPIADLEMANDLAQKELALDPTRPRTFALLGALSLMKGDHAQAVAFGEKAVALDPNGAEDAALLALTLTYTKDPRRSVAMIEEAMRLSPCYPDWFRWVLGRAHRLTGRLKQAEAALDAPGTGSANLPRLVELAATYSEAGRLAEAHVVAAKILHAQPEFSVLHWTEAPPYQDVTTTSREVDILRRAGLPQ